MKFFLAFLVSLALLAGCQRQPTYTDNGNPGQIKALVFYDDNGNRVMDSGEEGLQTELGISQDIACPPSRKEAIRPVSADSSGEALLTDLKPGKYCLHLIQNFGMTTRQNLEVYVSSDETTTVVFGVVRD